MVSEQIDWELLYKIAVSQRNSILAQLADTQLELELARIELKKIQTKNAENDN